MINEELYNVLFKSNNNEFSYPLSLHIVTYSRNKEIIKIIISNNSIENIYEVDKTDKMIIINDDVKIKRITKNDIGYIIYFEYSDAINHIKFRKDK